MNVKVLVGLMLFSQVGFAETVSNDIQTLNEKLIQQISFSKKQQKEINELSKRVKAQEKLLNEFKRKSFITSNKLNTLTSEVKLVNKDNQEKLSYLNNNVDGLNQSTLQIINDVKTTKSEISQQLSSVENKFIDNEKTFSSLDSNLKNYSIYGLIGFLSFLTLLSCSYLWLNYRIKTNNKNSFDMINKTRKHLEEETIKLETKLIDLLEKQLQIEKLENVKPRTQEQDHSLALKVADEIIRIQKNIFNMDSSTKGLKQLSASVKRIQDNFLANGYELVDMLGKDYQEGMNAIANFVTSNEIESGKQIISRIIKPQVNFYGVMIQAAQIEVTIGE